MLAMTVGEAAALCGGTCLGNREQRFVGVSTDTRQLVPGSIFVALKGERFDGHDHVAAAVATGAAALLVAKTVGATAASILVADPLVALQSLARAWRARSAIPVVALTGSNGKTTVKEMLRAILVKHHQGKEEAVLATIGNLNNHIGVPLTLARLGETHQAAVIEAGMNHFGEIRLLTHMIAPNIALINNAGPAHLEGVGDLAGVAQAKGELLEGLSEGGAAVLNADDPFYTYWRARVGTTQKVIGFGVSPTARIRGVWREVSMHAPITIEDSENDTTATLRFPLAGHHNRMNALAAAAAARGLDVSLADIGAALSEFSPIAGRQRRVPGKRGAQIIDDTYNANPASMQAAIATLSEETGRTIAVLGQMAELGAASEAMHENLGVEIAKSSVDSFFAVGERMRVAVAACNAISKKATWFASRDDLVRTLNAALAPGVVVLVKGSRSSEMEHVVSAVRLDESAHVEAH